MGQQWVEEFFFGVVLTLLNTGNNVGQRYLLVYFRPVMLHSDARIVRKRAQLSSGSVWIIFTNR